MTNLVIVESPTKAKTLSRFLGDGYRIEATMGHVRDLPPKKLGIIITATKKNGDDNLRSYQFTPEYEIIPERKSKVLELKKLSENFSSIILATDPDREGEAIAWHVRYLLTSKSLLSQKFLRIVFHEITESAIRQALANPQDINQHLVEAQQARRVLDRLVGYKLSPLLWKKIGMKWLSAGRVQSVAVRLIVEREREIENFKPSEYWLIDVELKKAQDVQKNGKAFFARLVEAGGKKIEIKNQKEAEKVTADLKKAHYQVKNIETKEVLRFPFPPFTTSTLQQTASNRFGWSAKKIMRAAQNLYEEGFITYHRTDSTSVAVEALAKARDYIKRYFGQEYLPLNPPIYKTKSKVAQEAHEAIRPTDIQITSENLKAKKEVGRDEVLLYDLIWKRFIACQMVPAVFLQTTAEIEANLSSGDLQYLLKASGEKIKFTGWLTVYGNKEEEKNKKELPPLVVGEILNLLQVLSQQKFTEPPSRYTEATLIKALEEKGIGRPSTYAPIISTIQERKYVEKKDRKFFPTILGQAVNDFLVKYFPDIFEVSFTASMEDELDDIANGKREWNQVISDFYAPFSQKLEKVFKEGEKVKIDFGQTAEKCQLCGANLVVKMSKYGKFLACSNFPRCKFTKNFQEEIEIPCPRCGGKMLVKKTKRGKKFYGCSRYPACHFAAWKKEDIK